MWNFSARSVIEASARPSCSRTPRRVASESAANEASKRVWVILNHVVQYLTHRQAARKGRLAKPLGLANNGVARPERVSRTLNPIDEAERAGFDLSLIDESLSYSYAQTT